MDPLPAATHGSAKPDDYFEQKQPGILEMLPPHARRFLDVGCAGGALGEAISERVPGAIVHGIERHEPAALHADKRLARVFRCDLERPLEELDGPYDCITCCDVLEHVVDPWSLLRALVAELSPEGVVLASIPNLRYYPVVRELVWEGRFTYRESGVLDATHLRFFTRAEMVALFESAGLVVTEARPVIDRHVMKGIPKLLRRRLEAFRAAQYLLAGRRRDP